jgi:hypothetical protein
VQWSNCTSPGVNVIGWRYADAATTNTFKDAMRANADEKPDPYAELKAAHAAGKVIQRHTEAGWIDHIMPSEREPIWFHPAKDLRIKPDDSPPWIEHKGGPCPLKDEEVEEWEYKCRNGYQSGLDLGKPSFRCWSHSTHGRNHGADIVAYRVLKWRTPKPKVPLGPEDVRCGDELLMAGKRYGILTVTDAGVEYLASHGRHHVTFVWLQKNGVTIRRRNSDTWEACEK